MNSLALLNLTYVTNAVVCLMNKISELSFTPPFFEHNVVNYRNEYSLKIYVKECMHFFYLN